MTIILSFFITDFFLINVALFLQHLLRVSNLLWFFLCICFPGLNDAKHHSKWWFKKTSVYILLELTLQKSISLFWNFWGGIFLLVSQAEIYYANFSETWPHSCDIASHVIFLQGCLAALIWNSKNSSFEEPFLPAWSETTLGAFS